jgi:arabinogalactan endo-1,4-beta-galactosidase
MKYILLIFICCILIIGCSDAPIEDIPEISEADDVEFIYGADLSFIPQLEKANTVYYDSNGNPGGALQLLVDEGLNTIRIRLWHTPDTEHSSFTEVKLLSNRAKSLGLDVLLTVHYSDSWADPGKQILPAKWQNISYNTLKDSVYNYTKKIITELNPDYIQIGNEINPGFLFPFGKISSNPSQFIDLLATAIAAVKDHRPSVKTILHYAGINGSIDFFDRVDDLPFDIIALSYYPWWHGKDLVLLKNTMASLMEFFNKDVMIAETAYPFTLSWNDLTHNMVGSTDQIIYPQFPATPAGQKEFLFHIKKSIQDTGGLGFCYWGTEWVAFNGPDASNGSPFENLALFDFNNKILPAVSVYNHP